MLMGSLKGKTTVITGGTSGMGEGVAVKFHDEGSNLIIGGRDNDKWKALIGKTGNRDNRIRFIPGDVAEAATNKKLVDEALAEFGGLDIMVISAGKPGTAKDIAEAVLFLAGDSSSWITGSCLTIDGGFLCT